GVVQFARVFAKHEGPGVLRGKRGGVLDNESALARLQDYVRECEVDADTQLKSAQTQRLGADIFDREILKAVLRWMIHYFGDPQRRRMTDQRCRRRRAPGILIRTDASSREYSRVVVHSEGRRVD